MSKIIELFKRLAGPALTFLAVFTLAKVGVVRMLTAPQVVDTAYRLIDIGYNVLIYAVLFGCAVWAIWTAYDFIKNRNKPPRLSRKDKAFVEAIRRAIRQDLKGRRQRHDHRNHIHHKHSRTGLYVSGDVVSRRPFRGSRPMPKGRIL